MQVYQGKTIFEGIGIGKIHVYKKGIHRIGCNFVEDTQGEIKRLEGAKDEALKQMQVCYQKALEELGTEKASIFQVHKAILQDEVYLGDMYSLITKNKYNAEYAVTVIRDKYLEKFEMMEDAYLKARALDIQDITERLLQNLRGERNETVQIEPPGIILAEELTPSQTMQLDLEKVKAIVTVSGSQYSHTSILAKTMGIPALILVGMDLDTSMDGKMAIADAVNGCLYVEPDEQIMDVMQERYRNVLTQRASESHGEWMEEYFPISICANINSLKDLERIEYPTHFGIGLFRSEFMFFEKDIFPTEDEQFRVYKKVLEEIPNRKVVIRTLDIGADKQCAYFPLEEEENPALGLRGIRVTLRHSFILRIQLRALLRAAIYGELWILYPMITSLEEVKEINHVLEQVRKEMTEEGIAYGVPKQGIMIETPAAVMISDLLAKEVDFFSIGTNDLTQYTLAMDRKSTELAEVYNPRHPAVIRMIEMVVKNGHKEGIPVSVCGELSSDLSMTEEFIKMGVDELSVAPAYLTVLTRKIRSLIKE